MDQLCAGLTNNDAAYKFFRLHDLPLVTKVVASKVGTALHSNTTVQRMDIPLDHLAQDLDDESLAGIVQFLATSSSLHTVRLTNDRRPMDENWTVAERLIQALVSNRSALQCVVLEGFAMPAYLLAELISGNQFQDLDVRKMHFVGDQKPVQDVVCRNRSMKRLSLDGSEGEDIKRNAEIASSVLKGLTGNASSVVQTIAIYRGMQDVIVNLLGDLLNNAPPSLRTLEFNGITNWTEKQFKLLVDYLKQSKNDLELFFSANCWSPAGNEDQDTYQVFRTFSETLVPLLQEVPNVISVKACGQFGIEFVPSRVLEYYQNRT